MLAIGTISHRQEIIGNGGSHGGSQGGDDLIFILFNLLKYREYIVEIINKKNMIKVTYNYISFAKKCDISYL